MKTQGNIPQERIQYCKIVDGAIFHTSKKKGILSQFKKIAENIALHNFSGKKRFFSNKEEVFK
jgi:hypothetical protein